MALGWLHDHLDDVTGASVTPDVSATAGAIAGALTSFLAGELAATTDGSLPDALAGDLDWGPLAYHRSGSDRR